MPTLILPPRYTIDSIALWKTAIALGWSVERLQNWRIDRNKTILDPFIYGEPLFAEVVAESLSIGLIEPQLDWLTTLPNDYTKRKVKFMTLSNLEQITETSFIKPAKDKCFAALVYQSGKEISKSFLPSDTPILVSEPVEWEIEFRCFINDRQIKTISSYWQNGKSTEQPDGSWLGTATEYQQAQDFCNRVLDDSQVEVPDAVVIDVGKIVGKGWAVIEANSAFGSGLYGCDPYKAIEVIKKANVPT